MLITYPITKIISFATFALLLLTSGVFGQNVQTHLVEPVGPYKEIKLAENNRVLLLLYDTAYTGRDKLVDSIEKNPNIYVPPVLYLISSVLFEEKRYDDAEFWFYTAQLRARYDVNRCADKTADASSYNMIFGMTINEYAIKQNLDKLPDIIKKVVDFVRNNEEKYDQRWINLMGMDAMTASLNHPSKFKSLSVDSKEWPAIKEKTIKDYEGDFKKAMIGFRQQKE